MKAINPILKGFNPDPSIMRDKDDFYIATSTFEWFPGVQIHHSKDLKNWKLIKRPLDRISQLDMKGNDDSGGVWAPCLSKADNLYWLIYTDVKRVGVHHKDTPNYLVTSDDIMGDWSEPIYLNSSGFDPSLFHDDDGRKYLINMVWDHRPNKHPFKGIVIQEYCHEQKKLIGEIKTIFKGSEIKLTEGPHIYKKDGYYYLVVAEGGTGYEHAVTVARSKSLMGEYEVHPQNPILCALDNPKNPLQKTGHASFVDDGNGNWYLVHLCSRPLSEKGDCPLGRETALQKLYWKNDWPYVEGGVYAENEVEILGLEEVKQEETWCGKDDFEDKNLNINYQTLRIPLGDNISLIERKSHLRIYGRESLTSRFTQAHVARRWQSMNFEAEIKLSFYPKDFQQSAGLTLYYNTDNWIFLSVTADDNKNRIIKLSHLDKGEIYNEYLDDVKIPEGLEYVYLRANVLNEKICFSYSFDAHRYIAVDKEFYSGQLSDDYVGKTSSAVACFTGAFVGMAVVDLTGQKLHADFDSFSYIENINNN